MIEWKLLKEKRFENGLINREADIGQPDKKYYLIAQYAFDNLIWVKKKNTYMLCYNIVLGIIN